MEIEHFEMIAAVVVLGLVLVTSIGFQVSLVEGLGDVGYDWNKGQNYKIAGAFRIANQGEEFGVVSHDSFEQDLRRSGEDSDYFCTMDLAGFRGSEPLAVDLTLDDVHCPDSHESVSSLVYMVFPGQQDSIEKLYVGGKTER